MEPHPITEMEPHPLATFTETPELAALGEMSRKEFTLARNMKDAIKPKAQEFEALKRDAKVKMEAQRDQHLERAKNALIDARQLMRDERLGSFDAWIKSKQICGMSGKPIGRAQVYRLIDGRSAGNVDKATGKRKPASPTGDCRRQSAPDLDEDWTAPATPVVEEQPKVVTTDDLRTWIDLKPTLPMRELFTALWDCMSGGERLTVHELVISDEWRSSRPRAIDRQPQ